jgi:hypothetical protein
MAIGLPISHHLRRKISYCIGDYSAIAKTSSPAERDFASLNLLICGNPPEADLRPRQSLYLCFINHRTLPTHL